jgi:hypothetical protein
MQTQFGINAVRTIRRASLLTTVLLLTSQIALAQWNTNSPHIYNSNSGNVGIGTSTPPELFSLLGGNVAVSTSGSSSSSPTTVGLKFTGSSGETGAFIFGDLLNSLGAMNGGKMLVQSFWGMKIVANRQSATAYSFENGNASGVPVLEVAADNTGSYAALGPVLLVVGASGQSANLQEWKNSSGTVLATVSPAGNITTVGTLPQAGILRRNTRISPNGFPQWATSKRAPSSSSIRTRPTPSWHPTVPTIRASPELFPICRVSSWGKQARAR